MTREELDTLWQQALVASVRDGELYTRYRFAKLVAKAEREACARVAEPAWDRGCDCALCDCGNTGDANRAAAWDAQAAIAKAIRARGKDEA